MQHIGHVGRMSVSGYRDRWFKPQLHQCVLSLSKVLSPHCFKRLSCEMSTSREHPSEGCLFSAMSFTEEIALKHYFIFLLSLSHSLWTLCCIATYVLRLSMLVSRKLLLLSDSYTEH